jgi:hypothetical protein
MWGGVQVVVWWSPKAKRGEGLWQSVELDVASLATLEILLTRSCSTASTSGVAPLKSRMGGCVGVDGSSGYRFEKLSVDWTG